jgi:hypothetical protein
MDSASFALVTRNEDFEPESWLVIAVDKSLRLLRRGMEREKHHDNRSLDAGIRNDSVKGLLMMEWKRIYRAAIQLSTHLVNE